MHIYSLHYHGISAQSNVCTMSDVMVPSCNFPNQETKEGESWAPGQAGVCKETLSQAHPVAPKLLYDYYLNYFSHCYLIIIAVSMFKKNGPLIAKM